MNGPDVEPRIGVAFRTLGCKVNRVESDEIAAELLGRSVLLVCEDEAAVIVVNTCTVTAEADAKARKAVRHALNSGSSPLVVVTGCLAALDADGLRSLGDRVIVEADKSRVAALVGERMSLRERASRRVARAGGEFRTRAMLKIEDGCDNFCSYCIVPYARGVPRAVSLDDLLREASDLVEAGVREIVLTGINLGRYRDGDRDLAGVVRRLAESGVARIRLSSIEPPDLTDELLEVLVTAPSVCEHVHVPLQSGSDSVLARMARKYDVAAYRARIDAARQAMPALAITTDVIAGFPGETEAEHAETLALAEELGFAKLHVFRYSVRPGTPAANMSQVDPSVRAARALELRQLGDDLRRRYVRAHTGHEAQVLVEEVAGSDATGTTRDYLRVRIAAEGVLPGDVRTVVLDSAMVVG